MSLFYEPGFTFICVDPGLRGCGVAEFKGGELSRAAYVENPVKAGRGYLTHAKMGIAVSEWCGWGAKQLIMEHPVIYPQAQNQKGDPNDLIDVACVGASIASLWGSPEVETVLPSEWKGQAPKELMLERIKRSMSHAETQRIEACLFSKRHNVLDAIGIGLWKLGRINKKRIAYE